MDEEIRRKIEAILFSVGRKLHVDELMRMIKKKDKGTVVACLIELKKKYNEDPNNSLMMLQNGDEWKLTIKDEYIDVAKEIGIETELSKTILETLAVIAYKYPILQSDLIKIRTNKAYDHLKELDELGYIQRERWGRTKKIKLTQKFFEYFDLPPDKLKEQIFFSVLIVLIAVSVFGFVGAVPNPASVYCEGMGYESDGEGNCKQRRRNQKYQRAAKGKD